MVIFRSPNLYSLYSPGNQNYQIIINFSFFFSSKRSKSTCRDNANVGFVLELVVIIVVTNRDIIKLIYFCDNAGFLGYKVIIIFLIKNYHIPKFVVKKCVRPIKNGVFEDRRAFEKSPVSPRIKIHQNPTLITILSLTSAGADATRYEIQKLKRCPYKFWISE